MNLSDLGRLGTLLRAVRRRLRLAWALDTVQVLAPVVAVVALVLVGWAWITPLSALASIPGERVAAVIAVAALAAVIILALVLRLPDRIVARAADRGLRTKDAFATALELPPDIVPFGDKIRERAIRLAGGGTAKGAVALPWRRRPVLLAAALLPVIVVLAVTTNPEDRAQAEDERNQAVIDDAVAELEETADDLAERPESAEAVERLDELTEQLEHTNDPAVAEELLREAAAELDQGRDPQALAERAATQGLESSVATEPLPGSDTSTGASEQFEQLAGELDSMTAEAMEEAATRLDDLAATQEAGDPVAAAALAAAAEAMRSGDVAAAAAALGEAADAHAGASASAAASAALGEASAAAGRAADGMSGDGQGGSDPTCRPETAPGVTVPEDLADLPVCNASGGSGNGNGSGNGTGDGPGSGNGAGGGGGGGGGGGSGGSGSGTIGGVSSNGSGASGQGGSGQAGSGTPNGENSDQSPELDTIFDPAHGSGGDQLTVGGGQGSGEGGTIGTDDGPTNDGEARVNIAAAVTDYANEATAAMDGAIVAPSDRELVTDYFDELQNRE